MMKQRSSVDCDQLVGVVVAKPFSTGTSPTGITPKKHYVEESMTGGDAV
jgi:hypothetical protein